MEQVGREGAGAPGGEAAGTGAAAATAGPAAAAAVAQGRPTPDFFIVGHQKCGTTALYLMLSAHPQIYMPEVKEPWYFARELRARSAGGAGGSDGEGSHSRPNSLDQYLALFADAPSGKLVGEASPQYIRSEKAAAEIAQLRPDAKIVAILREPAAFLRSLHMQLVSTHIESETDFRRAIELEPARREGRQIPRLSVSPQSLLYSDHVRYAHQLSRLHEAFPAEQVKVLIYEDYRRDNEGVVREVLEFLGADPTIPVQPVETKPLNAVRSVRLHRLRRAIRKAGLHPANRGPLVRGIDAVAPRRLRSEALSAAFRRVAYEQPKPADEELALQLRRRFKGEVEAASDYLGRDLVALWGYDRIS
ncbi:MAG TPA: sulfotransferase [Solirubrobacteraceae bacterium]|nr:sulfotransferase [Solirubrobacteraceae bacterium]